MAISLAKKLKIQDMVNHLELIVRADPSLKTAKEQAERLVQLAEEPGLVLQYRTLRHDAESIAYLRQAIYARAELIHPSPEALQLKQQSLNEATLRKVEVVDAVNIYKMPKLTPLAEHEMSQVTIGDLHANPIKLIYLLVRHRICEISDHHYQKLVDLYSQFPQHRQNGTRAEYEHINDQILIFRAQFRSILNREMLILKTDVLIRLIGDVLGDRGKSDLLILDVLDVLDHAHIEVRMLLANHDGLFIQAFHHALKGNGFSQYLTLDSGQSNSIDQLAALLYMPLEMQQGIWNEIEEMANRAYFPNLRLVDYSIGKDNHITLFSHAPIDLEVIQILANKYNVPYQPQTIETLAATIANINQRFITTLQSERDFNKMFQDKYIGTSGERMNKKNVIEYIMWNRNENLEGSNSAPNHNYTIAFVHGHTHGGLVSDTERIVYNLDNYLGKETEPAHDIPEEYKIFISNEPISHLLQEQVFTLSGEEAEAEIARVIAIFESTQATSKDIMDLVFDDEYFEDKYPNDHTFITSLKTALMAYASKATSPSLEQAQLTQTYRARINQSKKDELENDDEKNKNQSLGAG